jgi:hypothetical protein
MSKIKREGWGGQRDTSTRARKHGNILACVGFVVADESLGQEAHNHCWKNKVGKSAEEVGQAVPNWALKGTARVPPGSRDKAPPPRSAFPRGMWWTGLERHSTGTNPVQSSEMDLWSNRQGSSCIPASRHPGIPAGEDPPLSLGGFARLCPTYRSCPHNPLPARPAWCPWAGGSQRRTPGWGPAESAQTWWAAAWARPETALHESRLDTRGHNSAGMWRGQRCCPGSWILKSSGSAVAASGASFSPPLPGRVGAAPEQGTVTRGRALLKAAWRALPAQLRGFLPVQPRGGLCSNCICRVLEAASSLEHQPRAWIWATERAKVSIGWMFLGQWERDPFLCLCQTVLMRTLILIFSILYTECGGTLACYPSA